MRTHHGIMLWKLAQKFTFVMSDVKSSTTDTCRFKFASAECVLTPVSVYSLLFWLDKRRVAIPSRTGFN